MINITSSSLVTCITDAILSCENKSFKRLQAIRKIYLAFYHHVLLYELLNHDSNKGTWLIKTRNQINNSITFNIALNLKSIIRLSIFKGGFILLKSYHFNQRLISKVKGNTML